MESNKFILQFSPDYVTIFGEHATLFQKNWSQSSLSTHQSVWIGVRNPHTGNSSHYEPLNFSVMGDSYQKTQKTYTRSERNKRSLAS